MGVLNNRIKSYKKDFWDFKEYSSEGVHKLCRYPAVMVPPMQSQILNEIVHTDNTVKNVLDPFHGSGTVLYEGAKLGLTTYGIDINPLANLISHVKLEGLNEFKLYDVIEQLEEDLIFDKIIYTIHDFHNIDKWFREDIKESLSKVRYSILKIRDLYIRRYLWVCFAEIVRKYSNTRSSTFKLHIKEEDKILNMKNDIENQFIKKVKTSYQELLNLNKVRCKLFLGDSKNILSENIEKNSIDLICTSPPYGDNQTTVPYGQFSTLPLYWIDTKDCDQFPEELLLNYSSIDRQSLGGQKNKKLNFESEILNKSLSKISESKQSKVIGFMNDYSEVFKGFNYVLKDHGILVLTVGNRTVDRIEVPFDQINIDLANHFGMHLESIIERNIHNKVMPKNISNVKDMGSVKSMTEEKTLIFRKGN